MPNMPNENSHKGGIVTIYEYGEPLTDCKTNFENLFNNWSKFVTNSQHTKLISYHYVTTLTDSSQVAHYAKLANNWKSLGAKVSGTTGEKGNGKNTIYTRTFYLYPETFQQAVSGLSSNSTQKNYYRAKYQKAINIRRKNFKKKVQQGDKIYIIKLKVDGRKYNHYAVCRPSNHEIVYDPLFTQITGVKYRLDQMFSQ